MFREYPSDSLSLKFEEAMNEPLTVTSLTRNLSALQVEIEALRHDATHDKLTGLGNRRFLEQRSSGRGGFFVAIDLNGFKKAQDSHPRKHEHGDIVLRSFARLLARSASGDDRVACRTGGDEFVIWCRTYRAALRMRNIIHRWECSSVTASAGIGSTMELADRRCYESKVERTRPVAQRLVWDAVRQLASWMKCRDLRRLCA